MTDNMDEVLPLAWVELQNAEKARDARMNAQLMLKHWGIKDNSDYYHLEELLGHGEGFNIMTDMTESDIGLCALLCGPHGWAIYKMLLVKRGLVSND